MIFNGIRAVHPAVKHPTECDDDCTCWVHGAAHWTPPDDADCEPAPSWLVARGDAA